MTTTILLVEDDEVLLENVALELQMNGYRVLEANNGRRALELFRVDGQKPDIIVSDISMPEMDGFELLTEIRGDASLGAIPMLFVTAMVSQDSIRRGKQLGIDDYIVKPFAVDDLIIAIENKLDRSESIRRHSTGRIEEMRQNLLRVLAHELRTPLVPIQGGTEMLTDQLDTSDDSVKTLLGLIQSGVGRISRLADRMLALFVLDSGQFQTMHAQDSALCNLVEIAIGARMAIKKEHFFHNDTPEIVISGCDDPLFVQGVNSYLQLMLEEPLRNAVTYSPPGTQVEVLLRREGEQAQIIVSDRGTGIKPENLARVWERFEQIERTYFEQQGTGIGLSLARETARAHGGECHLDSSPGHGTRVTISLPLAKDSLPGKDRRARQIGP